MILKTKINEIQILYWKLRSISWSDLFWISTCFSYHQIFYFIFFFLFPELSTKQYSCNLMCCIFFLLFLWFSHIYKVIVAEIQRICCTFYWWYFVCCQGLKNASWLALLWFDKLFIRAFCETSAINNSLIKNEEVHDTS